MERVLSQDERIRRAEEIYARRRMQTQARSSATVNVEENQEQKINLWYAWAYMELSLLWKIFQILCLQK